MKSGIWHKRFKKPLHPTIKKFSDSTAEDERLVIYEIMACLAHVQMLRQCGIVKKTEANSLLKALNKILTQYKSGKFKMHSELEDVHMNIEEAVKIIAGKSGDKLHTARSRNDLIATDLRLYARDSTHKIISRLIDIQKQLLEQAKRNSNTVIPGFTHLRPAQPITWSFYMHAQFQRFARA